MLTVKLYNRPLIYNRCDPHCKYCVGLFPLVGMDINCIKRLQAKFIQPFWLYHNYCFSEASERLEASDQKGIVNPIKMD